MPVFDMSHLPSKLRDKLVGKLQKELNLGYCKTCGSQLGIDCGEAEPDYNSDYCSEGCYESRNLTYNI